MKQRILTAIVALIIFLPFLIYGKLPFALFVYLLATIGLLELLQMKKIKVFSVPAILAIVLLWGLLLTGNVFTDGLFTKTDATMLFVLFLLIYTVLVKNKFTFDDAGFVLLATIFTGMGFFYLIETRDSGLNYMFFVLLIIWATDTGAYFTGRFFGKRKLWPKISPNKTVEGALGGIVLACIVGLIFQLLYPFDKPIAIIFIVTIAVSVFGQIGDLVESAFKRHFDVKDSGNILPGHGGILDRFDSLMFVLPLLHFIQFV